MTLVVICIQACGRSPLVYPAPERCCLSLFLAVKSVGTGPTNGDGAVVLDCRHCQVKEG